MTTYDSLVKLWSDYQAGLDDHDCPERNPDDFIPCEVCEHSIDARSYLSTRLADVMNLLQREHDALAELAESVIQEVPMDRPERVQKAMLRALAVLKC